jgi:hypothetical protein
MIRNILGSAVLPLVLALTLQAQNTSVVPNAAQSSQPAAPANGASGPTSSNLPPAPQTAPGNTSPAAPSTMSPTTPTATSPSTIILSDNGGNADDNPYDPLLEPPPLPKGNATLIGGIATSVDHVRNHITIQPFGRGKKMKVFVDARSHIYRNGTPTTILGIHKGDRIYVDTMLDRSNNKVFAKNVRVITEIGLAEIRGQVIGTNPDKDTITVRDQLSARPVTFAVSSATSYSSTKGPATAGDVQPGSLIDVQFSPRREERDIAREITVIAKPGDNYIFSGVVTNLDMRTDSMFVDNKSDDQNYEIHFLPADVAELRNLRVGSEVTARAVFDGKQYKASNIEIDSSNQEGEQSKAQ